MEGLNVTIKTAVEKGIFKGKLSKIRVFGTGAPTGETSQWANILGCEAGSLPFTYLGIPVGANMNLHVIEKFRNKLSSWKSKTLSFGGRLTLIKSVLGNLPTYYLSIFRALVGVIESLEKTRRRFLWGGNEEKSKINWFFWENVIAPKELGGLRVGSIRALNMGLIIKEADLLWAKGITGLHNLYNKPMEYLSKRRITGVWNNIVGTKKDLEVMGISFNGIFKHIVKTGDRTQFWWDKWVDDSSLKSKYLNLYNIEKEKSCLVVDRRGNDGKNWKWKTCPITVDLSNDLVHLTNEVATTHILMSFEHYIIPMVYMQTLIALDLVCLMNMQLIIQSHKP
uniref:Uncharacterized protein n=1 Tax=Lactuca sativa TaxID=4236 RepID=A0A9R1XIL2_LACSA|nr:hypothetical protein LSAT_V11C400180310 [Lactuca sativa]